MQITRQISIRLFLLLFVSMSAVFGAFLFLSIRLQEKHLLEFATLNNAWTSDVILSALQHSMLQNNRTELNHAIRAIGGQADIRGARIINKTGEITFSSQADEIGAKVDMTTEACWLCHSDSQPLSQVTVVGRTRIFTSPAGERILGIITPIENSPDCSSAACHAHPRELTVLGVLDLKMSLARAGHLLAESKYKFIIYSAISISVIILLIGYFIFQVVQRPVHALTRGTQEIAKGNLDYSIDFDHPDEIGQLARSFNYMVSELKKARREITDWNAELERRVDQKHRELVQAQERMREIDKLASLGKLAASVAHELNNPLAGILTYSKLVERKLSSSHRTAEPEIFRILKIIQQETDRCGNIVKDLLVFARRDGGAFTKGALHQIISKSLSIIMHKITMQEISVLKEFTLVDDTIECDASQIQQALLSLLVNATEAMPNGGTLTIKTAAHGRDRVAMIIKDTGVGIPDAIKPHIFEPFFSTKENEKGVGLGLAVVFGIVQRHNGTISVDSRIGKGTTFRIVLPKYQSEAAPQETEQHRGTP